MRPIAEGGILLFIVKGGSELERKSPEVKPNHLDITTFFRGRLVTSLSIISLLRTRTGYQSIFRE